MTINRVPEMAEASKVAEPKNMNTWVGVWYDYKTHSLYTTAEKVLLDDDSHAYAVGEMFKPNTESEITQMVRRWMNM